MVEAAEKYNRIVPVGFQTEVRLMIFLCPRLYKSGKLVKNCAC